MYGDTNLRIYTVSVLLLQVCRIFSGALGKVHEKINGHGSSLSELRLDTLVVY